MIPLDLQLNGYRGVDFIADDLLLDRMRHACSALEAEGGGRMLATVITDRLDRMVALIERLAEFHAADAHVRDMMVGIHVEGPFINPLPGYVGAHLVEHVLPADVSAARQLVDAVVGEDGAAWATDRSHVVGSTATLGFIRQVLRRDVGLSADEVEHVTALNPAAAISAAR